MDLGTISSRYARALFSLAKEKGEDGRVYDDLKVLKESLHETKELLTTLCNPMVANCKKETLLQEVVCADCTSVLSKCS